MALNINVQGDCVNQNNNIIECKFQAFSTNIQRWSDIRGTEQGQYNINFGDGDLNTQSGSVSIGDVLLLILWTGGETREDEEELFSATSFIYDGNDNIIQNVQLLAPHSPWCNFNISSQELANTEVSVQSLASTTFQWTFENRIFYQRKAWYGQTIFKYLDIFSDEFNFNGSYSLATTNIYDGSGVFDIFHRVTNTYMQSSECTKETKVYYSAPVGGIFFSDTNPISGSTITVEALILDLNGRTISIKHSFDSVEIESNIILDFQYDVTLNTFKEYTVRQEIVWNNGFEDLLVTFDKILYLQNQPPVINIAHEETTNIGAHQFTASASDIDGTISEICWKVYYEGEKSGLPFPFFRCSDPIETEFNEIYSICGSNADVLDLTFAIPGTYKISALARDNLGAEDTDEVTVDIVEVCDGIIADCEPCPDCPPEKEYPDCPEQDCDKLEGAIRLAIENYIREEEATSYKSTSSGLIVVQDGSAANTASGTIGGTMIGKYSKEDLVATMTRSISGNVSGGKTSGLVNSGSISGKVRK